MKNIRLLIFLSILISCNQNDETINQLRSENKQLKRQLQTIKQEIEALEFTPILIARSDTIKEGGVFESNIGMVIGSNQQVVSVSVGEIIDNEYQPISEDLDKTYGLLRVFNNSELSKGEHEFQGEVTFTLLDSTYSGLFSTTVLVKE